MNLPENAPTSLASQLKLDAHWMPYTANRNFQRDPRLIVGAEGSWLIDDKGRRVYDSLSGLWTCGAGHTRKEIQEAVAKQLGTLDYSPGFQYGHPLSFQLAEKITDLTPGNLNHVFFTDSGSECADTAVKMVRAYWRLKGQATKTKMIGRARGYHGVNIAGTSLGGVNGNRKLFGQAMMDVDHLPHTLLASNAYSRGMPKEGGIALADELLKLIELHDASNIAAVFVEPMAGSAGVLVPPEGYLKRLREICDQHNILLVFDEVITGFGRTGSMFGADSFGVTPDLMCIAKQVTNGAIPMGAVIASSEIYQTFMNQATPEYAVEFPTAIPTRPTRWRAPQAWRHSTYCRRKTWYRAWLKSHRISKTRCTASRVRRTSSISVTTAWPAQFRSPRVTVTPSCVRSKLAWPCGKLGSTCASVATPCSSAQRSTASRKTWIACSMRSAKC